MCRSFRNQLPEAVHLWDNCSYSIGIEVIIDHDIVGKIYIESRSIPEVKIEDNVAVDDLSPDRRDGPEKNVNIMKQLVVFLLYILSTVM